jgi:hypothetical protein
MRGASFSFFRLLSGTSRRIRMATRISFEANENHQVLSLDELGNSIVDAIRNVIRNEIERALASLCRVQKSLNQIGQSRFPRQKRPMPWA